MRIFSAKSSSAPPILRDSPDERYALHWPFAAIERGKIMTKPNFFEDMQAKIQEAIDKSPAKDVQKNVKAMMTQGFSRLDLVTREEFDIQTQVLTKTRAKLEALELRVAELETQRRG
jgi:BMFP domain-containing protein YqiC